MAPRAASTASSEATPPRMPFAHAEALLWWPELRKQHAWLLGEMRTVQAEHEAYNSRIQKVEAVAEAAETAALGLRDMEQQIAALEAVDKDKTFEKWATEEMTRLKTFADTNQSVRQKQAELETSISNVADELGRLGDVAVNLKSLQQRLDVLETGRKHDADHIKDLELKIASLEAVNRVSTVSGVDSRVNVEHKQSLSKPKIPTRVQHIEDVGEATETEDEDAFPPTQPLSECIQVPRSPDNSLGCSRH